MLESVKVMIKLFMIRLVMIGVILKVILKNWLRFCGFFVLRIIGNSYICVWVSGFDMMK